MRFLIIVALALFATSCKVEVPTSTPTTATPAVAVQAAPAAVSAPVAAPVVVKGSAVKAAKPVKAKASTTSAAEKAAYAKAYHNAERANILLGRHAYFTGPNDMNTAHRGRP